MKEKLARLLHLIWTNRSEVEEITPVSKEYYFRFRQRYFSVTKGTPSDLFFAYPKWKGSIQRLANMDDVDNETGLGVYVYITAGEASGYLGADLVTDLYSWLESKSLGLDELFSDFGIE